MKPILPQDINLYWQKIKPVLERLQKFGTDGWVPEDVYAILVYGHATLYINEDQWNGFCILQLLPNYWGKRLHCWIAQCDRPDLYLEELRHMAKQYCANRITFESSRKGWGRRAKKLGFKEARRIYEMEV